MHSFVVALALMLPAAQAGAAPDAPALRKLLDDFLAGAGKNDAAMHDRFWADDLIYTGSSGRRVGKADIMKDVRGAPAPKPEEPVTVYTAEDVRIQQYADTAVVAFRLVATTKERDGKTDVGQYLNTGTFLKRKGEWRVVSWQATRLPRPEEAAAKAVEALYGGLQELKLIGLPNEAQAKDLAPLLSAALNARLAEVRSLHDREAKAHPDEKPPFADGSLFTSLFEGFTTFEAKPGQAQDGGRQRVVVSFTYASADKPKDKVEWQDAVTVIQENGRWVVDDVAYLGQWTS